MRNPEDYEPWDPDAGDEDGYEYDGDGWRERRDDPPNALERLSEINEEYFR